MSRFGDLQRIIIHTEQGAFMSQQQNAALIQEQNTQMKQALEASAAKFSESNLDFSREQVFATEQLLKNDYTLKVARQNPNSLRLAMHNVASVGLSLNPQLGQAYLIPRRLKRNEPAKIVLDISYRGLIEIATSSGSIIAAKSLIVYSNDHFQFNGPMEKPIHDFDPFASVADRGEIRGVYCLAKLASGDLLVETMSIEQVHKIRDKSDAYSNGVGPWVEWYEEMVLKCPIKRGFKWWPNQSSQRMAEAMRILNEENGEGLAFVSSQGNNAAALPPPPPRESLSLEFQNEVARYVSRAADVQAWEACKDLMEQRIKQPGYLSFALNELEKAKQAQSTSDIDNEVSVTA